MMIQTIGTTNMCGFKYVDGACKLTFHRIVAPSVLFQGVMKEIHIVRIP